MFNGYSTSAKGLFTLNEEVSVLWKNKNWIKCSWCRVIRTLLIIKPLMHGSFVSLAHLLMDNVRWCHLQFIYLFFFFCLTSTWCSATLFRFFDSSYYSVINFSPLLKKIRPGWALCHENQLSWGNLKKLFYAFLLSPQDCSWGADDINYRCFNLKGLSVRMLIVFYF